MPLQDKLRLALHELEWTESELARLSGVPQRTVNSLMTGESRMPYWQTVRQIARTMGLSLDWLAIEGEEPSSQKIPDWAWIGPEVEIADEPITRIVGMQDSTRKHWRKIKQLKESMGRLAQDADPPRTDQTSGSTNPRRRPH